MKLRRLAELTAVAAVALTLAACGSNKQSSSKGTGNYAADQTVNWMENSQLPSMDISLATDEISMNMLNNTNEGLYRLGKDNKVEAGIATKTKISKDQKTWTFTLRKNAKWSNGDPVTAQNFVYSWQRTVNPKTAAQYSYIFDGVKNADKIMKGKAPVSSLGIKADGKYKLTVTLEKNIPYFKLLLGYVPFFPQDQAFVQKKGKAYGTKSSAVLSNGPFKIEGWTGTNDSWKLVKNNKYWDAKAVHLKTLNDQVTKDSGTALNLFQSGKLDEAVLSGNQVKNMLNNKSMHVRPMSKSAYLEVNRKKVPAFKNQKIRQAMSYALNRTALTKDVLSDGSFPAKGFVTKGLAKNPKTGADFTKDADSNGTGVSYNTAKAKKLWKQGLKEIGKKSVSFTLMTDDTPQEKQTGEYVQSQLQKELPGIKISLNAIPYKQRLAKSAAHQFQMVLTLWGADYSDPSTDLDIMTSDNSYNNGQWKNTEYDKLIERAGNEDANKPEARWNDMVKAEQILMKDQGVIPLFQSTMPQLLNAKVKGVIYNTAGTPFNFKNMYVSK